MALCTTSSTRPREKLQKGKLGPEYMSSSLIKIVASVLSSSMYTRTTSSNHRHQSSSLYLPKTFFHTGVFGLSISKAEDGILTFGGLGLVLLSLLGKGLLASSVVVSTLTAESGRPFSRSRVCFSWRSPWRRGVSALCCEFALFNLLAVSPSCTCFSIGENVIFFGVRGVATALTALVTLRADRRRPSLIFHCLFFARKNNTAVVARRGG